MSYNMDNITVEFHDRARSVMFNIYKTYVRNLSTLDRQGSENVYQQSSNRYCDQLRQQLDNIVKEILNTNQGKVDLNKLNKTLTYLVSEYETEFRQKIRSL